MEQFECDGCGACCKTFPIFAAEADAVAEPRIRDEARRLPEGLATPRWTYQLYPLPFHEACCFLDGDNRCTVYATRPTVCRTFAAGSAHCQEARARVGLALLSPSATPCNGGS
jgi:Fe-S-cluster containining protein